MFKFAMFHLGLLVWLCIPVANLFVIFYVIPRILRESRSFARQENISFWEAYKFVSVNDTQNNNEKVFVKQTKIDPKSKKAVNVLLILIISGILLIISPMLVLVPLFIFGLIFAWLVFIGLLMAAASFIKLN